MVAAVIISGFSSCREDQKQTLTNTQLSMDEMLKDNGLSLRLNPSGRTPLAAELKYTSLRPSTLELSVLGTQPVSTAFADMQRENAYPVLGLYPATENRIAIRITDDRGNFALDTLTIRTDSLYEGLPEIHIPNFHEEQMEAGMHLAGLHLADHGDFSTQPIIFDNQGVIRYHLDLSDYGSMLWPLQLRADGSFMMAGNDGIFIFDRLGNELRHFTLPGYRAHHDVIEMPNGNLMVAVQKYGTQIHNGSALVASADDHILELDGNSGQIVDEWDLRQLLDVDRHVVGDGGGDWFHTNALWYSEKDDCIIVSGRNQGVVKITRGHKLKWILATHKGWGKSGPEGQGAETAPYLLQAVDGSGHAYDQAVQDGDVAAADFDWPWGQHAPMLTGNGNLLLFDNGYNRQYGNSSGHYSRAVEYHIDEEHMRVKQVWEYGKSRGAETYSLIISDVDVLPTTGNILFSPGVIGNSNGNSSRMVELNYPSGAEIFEAQLHFKNLEGDGSFAWGQMDIMYRAERLSLYP